MEMHELLKHDSKFRYILLGRMQSDCEYFLGNGGRNEKHLWAGSSERQIEFMKFLYDSFSDNEKPEWITDEKINEYKERMTPMKKLVLTHIGRDSWSRPVYQSGKILYVDVNPSKGWPPSIHTKYRNAFDGEPDSPIPEGLELEFVLERDIW